MTTRRPTTKEAVVTATADHFDMARFRDDVNAYVTRQGHQDIPVSRSRRPEGSRLVVHQRHPSEHGSHRRRRVDPECDLDLGSYVTPVGGVVSGYTAVAAMFVLAILSQLAQGWWER